MYAVQFINFLSENFDRNYSQVVCWKKLTVIKNYQIWYKLQKYKYIFIFNEPL